MALPKVDYDLIRLSGGMDQVTPTLSLPPGVIRRGANFECSLNGGYTRIAGYERFDGHAKPSDSDYTVLAATITGTVVVGNTVTGATSAATGKVIAVTADSVVVTRMTGTFAIGENITVAAVVVASVTDVQGLASDGADDAEYAGLAADEYRASIAAVPGQGSILGVAYYNGVLYAWRNAAGGLTANIYKSTAAGWVQVALGKELAFTLGTAEITEGQTVTGFTSGATGVVARVVLSSGLWTGTAAGVLVLSSTTGTFQAAESIRVGDVNKATASGAQTQITLLPNGRVQSKVANFGGGTANRRLYGCDNVNKGFEFDGTTYVQIRTGMTTDVPTCMAVHKQHLFFAFGSSLQNSAIADPYQWSPLLGADEKAMNDDITVLIPLPGDQTSGALAVRTNTDTSILYGTSTADFSLSQYNDGSGAMPYTGQNLEQVYVLSNYGVTSLTSTLNFGNFASASLTLNLRPFIQTHRALATASALSREKAQYRLFFSDGFGLYVTVVNGQYIGAMPVEYTNPVLCTCDGTADDGTELTFFGSSNGFVYQMDAGTSFDGEEIAASMTLVYNSIKAPRVTKRFRKASVELTGEAYAEFQFSYDIGYRSSGLEQASETTVSNDLRSAYFDTMVMDQFVFDRRELSPSEVEMTGTAENIAVRIGSQSAILQPFTINSIILHYTYRRGLR